MIGGFLKKQVNIKKIEFEKVKWENEKFLEEIRKELNNYVNDLDKILSKRYKKIIQELQPNIREKALKILQNKNLFDNDMEYIGNTNIVEFNKKEKILNGGYVSGRIIVNPSSAKQFYEAYIDFENGKTKGIRDLNYEKPLNELKDLSSLEVLYWYYFNEKTYQDFLKSTMLHEDIHRWTLGASIIDEPIDIFAMEGFVEKEARNVAEENKLEYAKCFRNDEILLIEYLTNGIFDKNDITMTMLYNENATACLKFAMMMKIFKELEEKSVDKAKDLTNNIYIELANNITENKTNNFEKNYREIFAGIKTSKSDEIIKSIETEIAKEKEHEIKSFNEFEKATIDKMKIDKVSKQTSQDKEPYQDRKEQQR